ncbi:hypothetical protein ODU73_001059 [Thermoclostridium stercorarium]|uniref:hypothetical protein n=1 Tax=Thermoclostridium stercorarium TaxID=1510 RepID=UPI00224978C6|nr:hypothetical protein [Thermoclostridium stercorarium]UZQ86601.1 hypothetical protein ODU73_001059 [Thermoclostridium stercorarium]
MKVIIKKILILFILIITAILSLVLTSKERPDTNTNGNGITSAPSGANDQKSLAEAQAEKTSSADFTIKTVTPEYNFNDIDPRDVNPEIPPIYDGSNAFTEYAKEKKFGDTVLKYWHFYGYDIVISDVENPGIYFGSDENYTDVEGITTFRGNHYRNSAAYGTRNVIEKNLKLYG